MVFSTPTPQGLRDIISLVSMEMLGFSSNGVGCEALSPSKKLFILSKISSIFCPKSTNMLTTLETGFVARLLSNNLALMMTLPNYSM